MIFMTVGDENRADLFTLLAKVRDVRQNEIDAGLFFMREGNTAVDDNDVILGFEDEHVFADFRDSTKENEFDRDSR